MIPQARRATAADAQELTRLRGVMFTAMVRGGATVETTDPTWRSRCTAEFVRRLGAETLVAFVVDAPDGTGLVASACGEIDERLPGPNRGRRAGHIANVVTDPDHRRRGYSRLVMTAMLTWFDGEGIERIDLHATDAGTPLYHSLGFDEARPALRRTRPRQAVAEPGTGRDSATSGSPASE